MSQSQPDQAGPSSDRLAKAADKVNSERSAEGRADRDPQYAPATQCQKLCLAVLLLASAVAFVVAWLMLFDKAQKQLHQEFRVYWEKPGNVVLGTGPPSFWYDSAAKQIVCRGPIDPDQKKLLAALVSSKQKESDLPDAGIASYWAALDQLAFVGEFE